MDSTGTAGALREFAVVLGLAVTGVALVSLVALTPWHPGRPAGAGPVIVEMHAPVVPGVAAAVR